MIMTTLCFSILAFLSVFVGDGLGTRRMEYCTDDARSVEALCRRDLEESYRPWENVEGCKHYIVQASEEPLPPIALVSYAMSGKNYLLHLIERSSGITTGNRVQCGGIGRLDDRRGHYILQGAAPDNRFNPHDDWATSASKLFKHHGMLLIRNPWMAIIATRQDTQATRRHCSKSRKLERSLQEIHDFQGEDFEEFVAAGAQAWIQIYTNWINNSPNSSNMVIVKYEDLIVNPALQVRRALNFLNATIDEGRLKCALDDPTYDVRTVIREPESVHKAFAAGHVNEVLENGIVQLNQLLSSKRINASLDYTSPNWSTVVRSVSITVEDIY